MIPGKRCGGFGAQPQALGLLVLFQCILVKGWKSSSGWGFPKGKINESEPTHECAIREVRGSVRIIARRPEILYQVLEETGYNLAGQLNPENVIDMSIKEQAISLFVVPGVPEDFPFKTRTRKEISVRVCSCAPAFLC
jgi:mRNA-decapping enzyme subunit 2